VKLYYKVTSSSVSGWSAQIYHMLDSFPGSLLYVNYCRGQMEMHEEFTYNTLHGLLLCNSIYTVAVRMGQPVVLDPQ